MQHASVFALLILAFALYTGGMNFTFVLMYSACYFYTFFQLFTARDHLTKVQILFCKLLIHYIVDQIKVNMHTIIENGVVNSV